MKFPTIPNFIKAQPLNGYAYLTGSYDNLNNPILWICWHQYVDDISAETRRLETAIKLANKDKNTDHRKVLHKELKDYLKKIDVQQVTEARQLLKERFNYPIFMYEAEKVGITATGEEDLNELYPNSNQPHTIEKTCLEWYREFIADPKAFAALGGDEWWRMHGIILKFLLLAFGIWQHGMLLLNLL